MQRIHRTLAVAGALILMIGCASFAQDDIAVTTVNEQPIMSSELEDELLRRWGDIGLASLIQELAIEQAAQEAGLSVTPEEVDQRRDMFQANIDARSGAPGQGFPQWLAQQKLTPYAFRQWIRTELLLEKLVGGAADVPEEEVAAFYQEHLQQFQQPERMRVSHICVNDQAEAARIRKEILDGKPFEQAATEYSTDPYTRDQGGAFGVITRGDSPFQAAAFALTGDKQMTDPVQSQMGWHIIRREEHLPASTPTYDEVKDQIRDQLESQKLLVLIGQKRAEIMQAARIEHQVDPDQLVGN